MYLAENESHARQFGTPKEYIIDANTVEDYGNQVTFLKEVAKFHGIKTVPTQKQLSSFIASRHAEGKIPAITLLKGRRELLLENKNNLLDIRSN